jgi:predicted nucleotidyltransferase
MRSLDVLLAESICDWSCERADVVGVALVGSHARGTARPDSDVDFVVLTSAPASYRAAEWPVQVAWPRDVSVRPVWVDVTYGALWARHLELTDGTRVEIGFAAPEWARVTPVDAGRAAVVQGGFKILWDPSGLLAALRRVIDVPEFAACGLTSR